MKHLFNDIPEEEKKKILELHSKIDPIIEEQASKRGFTANAVINGKAMAFRVLKFKRTGNGRIQMDIIPVEYQPDYTPNWKDVLSVLDFRGPIWTSDFEVKKYPDSKFININGDNYEEIAKKYGISVA